MPRRHKEGAPRGAFISTTAAALAALFTISAHAGPDKGKVNRDGLQSGQEYDRLIVRFDTTTRGNARQLNAGIDAVARGQGLGLAVRNQLAIGSHVIEVDRKLPAQAMEALLQAFARRADVEFAEPDVLMQANFTPNDQFYSVQWHYSDPISGMNVPGAWDIADGTGVVVAVLDTGQVDHVDLAANLVPGYDFISDTFVSRDGDLRDPDPNDEGDWTSRNECGFGSPATDSSWHGTHVAGTVAAVTDNGIGVAGVAYGARVQHVRVLGRCGGYLSDIADGIVWASGGVVPGAPINTTPASVINMSLGGSGSCGSTYQAAIDEAVANGASVVVSAGNSNVDAANARPANCDNVITVAASGQTGARAGYSNFGSLVEITAPGGDFNVGNGVASTLNSGTTTQAGDNYVYYQGTSMAAPHIAGLAALMLDVDPTLTPAEISQLIQDNARPLPGACSGGCGAGLADAEATLLALGTAPPPPPPSNTPPTANFSFACDGLSCQFTDSSSDSDGSVTGWNWDFGDGTTSTTRNPSRTYASGGTYTVTLTATDDAGASDSVSRDVTVSEPEPPGDDFSLSASGSKVRGRQVVDLNWSGSSAGSFDVKRDGATIATVSGSSYTDNTGNRGGGSYQYQVCEAGTSTCTNTVTVTF
jgi:serine protease